MTEKHSYLGHLSNKVINFNNLKIIRELDTEHVKNNKDVD